MNDAVAYHEAGHAVASLIVGFKFQHVTIVVNLERNSLGHIMMSKFHFDPAVDASKKVVSEVKKYIGICLAGPIAEERINKKANHAGARGDYEASFARAVNILGDISSANNLVNSIHLKTTAVFKKKKIWNEVSIVAKELVLRQKLSYDDVIKLLPHYHQKVV